MVESFIRQIFNSYAGSAWINPTIASIVLQQMKQPLGADVGLAERTVGTVKTHVRNIFNKLEANDRTQAAVRALRSGLIG